MRHDYEYFVGEDLGEQDGDIFQAIFVDSKSSEDRKLANEALESWGTYSLMLM